MIDQRFFKKRSPATIADLIKYTNAVLLDNDKASFLIDDVAPISAANESQVTFLSNRKYVDYVKNTNAGACFVESDLAHYLPKNTVALISDNPYLAFAKAAAFFYANNPSPTKTNIHPSAVIGNDVILGTGCQIGANAVIEDGANIGDNTVISPQVYIGAAVVIGKNCFIHPQVSITNSIIGDFVVLHAGCRIGQAGFGFVPFFVSGQQPMKIPQLGRVIIHDHVDIGANTCVDRGAGPDTVIGRGTVIDNMVQIAHNVQIGENSIIVSFVGISGSTTIGSNVQIGGQVGIVGHIKIGNNVKIAAGSGVMRNIEDNQDVGGRPAIQMRSWLKQLAYLKKIGN